METKNLADELLAYINETQEIDLLQDGLSSFYKSLSPTDRFQMIADFAEQIKDRYDSTADAFKQVYVAIEEEIDVLDERIRRELIQGAVVRIMTDSGPDLSDKRTRELVDESIGKYFK